MFLQNVLDGLKERLGVRAQFLVFASFSEPACRIVNRELWGAAVHRIQRSKLGEITAVGNEHELLIGLIGIAVQEGFLAPFRNQDNLVRRLDSPAFHPAFDRTSNGGLRMIRGRVNPIIAEIQNEWLAR